jgi:hypothetical protein
VHAVLEVLADIGKRYVCSDVFSGEAPAMLGFFGMLLHWRVGLVDLSTTALCRALVHG